MGRTKTIDDEEILSRARDVFRREGHAASTRDIAQAAGISQAVLFQRFGSKEELFFRAMTPVAPQVEALLGPYPPEDVRADLGRIAERVSGYLQDLMPTLHQALAHPHLGRERLVHQHQGMALHPLLAALTGRFRRLAEDGWVAVRDPAAAAHAFVAVVHAAALSGLMAHGGKARAREQLASSLEVLWRGLTPGELPAKKKASREGRPRG